MHPLMSALDSYAYNNWFVIPFIRRKGCLITQGDSVICKFNLLTQGKGLFLYERKWYANFYSFS